MRVGSNGPFIAEQVNIMEEITVDLWALTTLIEFGRLGYVKIG